VLWRGIVSGPYTSKKKKKKKKKKAVDQNPAFSLASDLG